MPEKEVVVLPRSSGSCRNLSDAREGVACSAGAPPHRALIGGNGIITPCGTENGRPMTRSCECTVVAEVNINGEWGSGSLNPPYRHL